MTVKKILTLAALAATLALPSFAANGPATKPVSPQHQKMRDCNVEYKERSIPKAERNQFMSACLKKSYVKGSYQSGQNTATANTPAQTASPDAAAATAETTATETTANANPQKTPAKAKYARIKKQPKTSLQSGQPAQ